MPGTVQPDPEQAEVLLPLAAVGPGEVESFAGAGGRRLGYRAVRAPGQRHTLVYCHGIESHGTWFLPAAERLRRHGCTTYLLDRRGSGLNQGDAPGDAASAQQLLADIRRFREHLGDPPLHLIGLSWGGKLATAAALDRPARVRSLILITPGLKAAVDLSPAQKLRLLIGLLTGGRQRVDVPIAPEMFSDVPETLAFIRGDTWRLRRVTGRMLLSSWVLDRMIRRRLTELRVPVLLCLAGRDRIIDNEGVRRLLRPLEARGRLRLRDFPEGVHSLQLDQPDGLTAEIAQFLEEVVPC